MMLVGDGRDETGTDRLECAVRNGSDRGAKISSPSHSIINVMAYDGLSPNRCNLPAPGNRLNVSSLAATRKKEFLSRIRQGEKA